MYLKNIIMNNVGPIEKLNIELPFTEDGRPKPIIFVGANGTGKSILLSHVADLLFEFANNVFTDILPTEGQGHKVLKFVDFYNQKLGTNYGFCFLNLKNGDNQYQYIEKTGNITFEACKTYTNDLLNINNSWVDKGNYKQITPINNDENKKAQIETDFLNNSYCYFPSCRFEKPHWFNLESNQQLGFIFQQNISKRLGKPIIINTSLNENKSWFLELFLDSRADIDEVKNEDGSLKEYKTKQNIQDINFLRVGRNNIEQILSKILCNDVILDTNYRHLGLSRLKILKKTGEDLIPRLDNLSDGQSVLLNLFSTIIRYSDRYDLNKSVYLQNIEGLVIIDEIDLHLHTDLQTNVLPKLLKLFPKVQFIITTHSPLFILGMENNKDENNNLLFGSDGFEIREMPSGELITAEKFSEFDKAYEVFQETKKFKTELDEYLANSKKPIVFVEGDYDIKYIRKAAELLNRLDFLSEIELREAGGFGNLNKIKKHFDCKLSELTPQSIILLYDCDIEKSDTQKANIYTRVVPSILDNPIKKGIENLFFEKLIQEAINYNSKFIDIESEHRKKVKGEEIVEPEKWVVNEDEKKSLCNWICNERENNESDFENFKQIFQIIESIIIEPPIDTV